MTQTQTQIICGIAELLKEIRANAPIDDVIRAEKIGGLLISLAKTLLEVNYEKNS